jgi:hypothetical protein
MRGVNTVGSKDTYNHKDLTKYQVMYKDADSRKYPRKLVAAFEFYQDAVNYAEYLVVNRYTCNTFNNDKSYFEIMEKNATYDKIVKTIRRN